MQQHQDRLLMRAVSLTSYGSEEGFIFLKSQPRPEIEESEVLVKVKCCAITDQDRAVLKGAYTELTRLPMVLGYAISGTVEEVGMEVQRFKVGDEVLGIAPLHVGGGYAEYAVFGHHDLVHKPGQITHEEASSAIIGGLRAYTALHYKAKVSAGDSVLIFNGASSYGHIAIQLAGLWGAKVLTTASSAEEINYLQDLSCVERIVDTTTENLFDAVMEETGGLGVDYIFETHGASPSSSSAASPSVTSSPSKDADPSPHSSKRSSGILSTTKSGYSPSSSLSSLPSLSGGGGKNFLEKSEVIRCLAVNGTWIASSPIQLDPPESKLLLLKGCNISFLFEQAWTLSSLQQGRYLHILSDLLDKLAKSEVVPKVSRVYPLEKIREAHRNYDFNLVGTILVKF